MHQHKPSGISASAGFSPTDGDLSEALTWFKRTSNLRDVSGVDTLKSCRELSSGAMAVMFEAGGLRKVHIIGPVAPEPHKPPPEHDGIAQTKIPMLYCGHVVSSTIDADALGVPVILTDMTRLRMVGYDDEKPLPPASQTMPEFAVEYSRTCDEFNPKLPAPNKLYTHFGNQHPTWYTGGMPALIQLVRGYGKQKIERDGERERARQLTLPEKVRVKAAKEMGANTRLPGYTGEPPEDGALDFDYKFLNTDTVGFDSESRPWLVKVSSGARYQRGVWAMPLPMIPMTTTTAFREWIEEKGDHEILSALDKFGGLPSGEYWPRDFEGWRKAGVVIKVCDVADYFSHTPYTTPCGFAFNSRATEGYATCFEHVEGGINLGHSYKMKLSLGAAEHHGWLPKEFHLDSQEAQDELNAVMSALYRKIKADESFHDGRNDKNAIFYKVRRAGVAEVFRLRDNLAGWMALELNPIATHSGSVSRVATGNLVSWTGGKLNGILPEAKLPEAITKEPGVISLSGFTDRSNDTANTKYPECDTILYGYYDDKDKLKTLKYFREADKDDNGDDGDEEPSCMLVGDFEWRGPATDKYILGRFHTSDLDDRTQVAENYTQYKQHGEYLYAGDWCVRSMYSAFSGEVRVFRYHYYQQERWETRFDYHALRNAIAVPYGQRSGYLYYREEADKIAGEYYKKWWVPIFDKFDFEGYANFLNLWYEEQYDGPPKFWYTEDFITEPPECALEAQEDNWRPDEESVKGVIQNGFPIRYWGAGGMILGKLTFPPNWQAKEKDTGPKTENEKYETVFFDGEIKRVLSTTQIPNYLMVSPDEQGNPYLLYAVKNAVGSSKHAYINEGNHHFARSRYVRDKQIPRFFGVIHE